jgi:YesN/AraC family two-component response regulator
LEKLALHPFDIVFTDLGMPKMPGDVLAKAIKKQSPQQIVVMLPEAQSLLTETKRVSFF